MNAMHQRRHAVVRPFVFIVAALTLLFGSTTAIPVAAAQATPSAAAADSIQILGDVDHPGPITVDQLKAMKNESLSVTFGAAGTPQDHTYVGTSLLDVLDSVGIKQPSGKKNPLLTTYIVVTANDGYQVLISGGELGPGFGNKPMFLAWEQDGQPLTGTDGPIRLVVPGDAKGGRYVTGVVSIEVLHVGETAATPAAS